MDPALRQLMRHGHGGDQLEAILRLTPDATHLPHGAREITRFGPIRTVRLARRDIGHVWAHPHTASLKAPRLLQLERPYTGLFRAPPAPGPRRPNGLSETGRGVVLGVIDWGFDLAHPAFRDATGRSRIRAFWDMRDPPRRAPHRPRPQPYGYGRTFTRAAIEAALAAADPYAALGYHPGISDRGSGAHGTHVADVAAGSPRASQQGGVAPGADLVFVHLGGPPLDGSANLGDSVRILEAIDFIARAAGTNPLAINMSLGTHGGSHMGTSLVERALDAFVETRPNTQIIQSAGNYFAARTHAAGRLAPGRTRTLNWQIKDRDPTTNELEIWYSNRDRFGLSVVPPKGPPVQVALGQTQTLRDGLGREIGRIYHRAFDPNTPDHHVNLFLSPGALSGIWQVVLAGEQISDGRFNAWIERDRAGRRGQSTFASSDVTTGNTIGSICNGFSTIAVGAADTTGATPRPARFASAGPTRDGRTKPDLVGPGVRIRAARSAPRGAHGSGNRSTVMSGASQAAPYVAGVAALCLEAGGGGLDAHSLRRALIGTARPFPIRENQRVQVGAGLVHPIAAVAAARRLGLPSPMDRSKDHAKPDLFFANI